MLPRIDVGHWFDVRMLIDMRMQRARCPLILLLLLLLMLMLMLLLCRTRTVTQPWVIRINRYRIVRTQSAVPLIFHLAVNNEKERPISTPVHRHQLNSICKTILNPSIDNDEANQFQHHFTSVELECDAAADQSNHQPIHSPVREGDGSIDRLL